MSPFQVLVSMVSILSVILLGSGLAPSAEAKPAWQVEWEKAVQAAKKEGQVRIYHSSGFGDYFSRFQKAYPELKLVSVPADGSVLGQRIMTERRAERYLADFYIDGVDTARLLYRAGVLDPIPPVLILPEVADQSKWWRGTHHYSDPKGRYTFVFQGTAKGASVAYSANLVNPEEFKSYWDFLNPKWKGKIVATDPAARSIVSHSLRFLYYNTELGPQFIRRFFSKMGVTFTRDRRQMLDWLAVGKYAISFFGSGVDDAKKQGLPVGEFNPAIFKEGVAVTTTIGVIGLLSHSPNPNAAKLFLNWLLSREGQKGLQKDLFDTGFNSMREDIPKDPDVLPMYRRREGVKYVQITRPEFLDMGPVFSLVEEAMTEARKK